MPNQPVKAMTFDKDELANRIVHLMTDPEYVEMPDTYKAQRADCSLSQLNEYMTNPAFLSWIGKRLPELYKAKLPELMNTMYTQALNGKGRQQKMMLEIMGMTDKKQENRSPNIVIVNQIPNPDDNKEPERPIIDVTTE